MAYMYNEGPAFYSPKQQAPVDPGLVVFFRKYLLQKAQSVFEWKYPEFWTRDQITHFNNVLFTRGYIGVFDTKKYGLVALACSFSGQNLFYAPTEILVANPLLSGVKKTIGKDCVLFTLQKTPNWSGYDMAPWNYSITDIIEYYATQMALAAQGVNANLINSQLSYLFNADNPNAAKSMKKIYGMIASGEPAVVADKNMFKPDGTPRWAAFQQNLGQNYIANDILQTISNLSDQFCTLVGIPNTNSVEKKERVTNVEISQNNVETTSLSDLWLENMKTCCEEVNEMFGVDMDVNKRYDKEDLEKEGIEDDTTAVD